MASVYEAEDTLKKCRVALKVLNRRSTRDPQAERRFEREAQILERLSHGGVVHLFSVERDTEITVLVLEWVEATALDKLLGGAALTPTDVVSLLQQSLNVFVHCHERGVVHCDIKPANLLVTRDGVLHVSDFGIAQIISGTERLEDPLDGHWGTPQYLPPEAWKRCPPGPAWDLFALGVTGYEALAGRAPFRGSTIAATRDAILSGRHVPLRSLRPECSEELCAFIEKLMARVADARFESARDALHELGKVPESALDEGITVPLEKHLAPETTEWRTWRWVSVFGFLVLLVMAACVGWFQLQPEAPGVATLTPDIGPAPSSPVATGGIYYFSADDGVRGRELWKVQSLGKPQLIADLVPGPGSSEPFMLMPDGHGGILFNASTPSTGEELWHFAGGEDATPKLLADVAGGALSSFPHINAQYGDSFVFHATTAEYGREPWLGKLDGTPKLLGDFNPGPAGSLPSERNGHFADGATYYFSAVVSVDTHRFYSYDLATDELRELCTVTKHALWVASLNGTLFFPNSDPEHGVELWCLPPNGEPEMLGDLWPGKDSSLPDIDGVHAGRVYFHATTPEYGKEMWVTDGSVEGTRLVKDIRPGPEGSGLFGIATVGKWIIYSADDGLHGREPWISDGTTDGTVLLEDINPGVAGSVPYNRCVNPFEPMLVFSADDGSHGEELWFSFYSYEGVWKTIMASEIFPGPVGSEPTDARWISRREGFFAAKGPDGVRDLYSFTYDRSTVMPKLNSVLEAAKTPE